MIASIFVVATLIFLATLPCILLGALSNGDAFIRRNEWSMPKLSFWRSDASQRQNSDRFLAWGLVKTCQVSFSVMVISYFFGRI